jgi:hypothetical protein
MMPKHTTTSSGRAPEASGIARAGMLMPSCTPAPKLPPPIAPPAPLGAPRSDAPSQPGALAWGGRERAGRREGTAGGLDARAFSALEGTATLERGKPSANNSLRASLKERLRGPQTHQRCLCDFLLLLEG